MAFEGLSEISVLETEIESLLTRSQIRCVKVCLYKSINLISGRNGSKNLGSADSFDRAHK